MSVDLSQFHQVFFEECFEGLDVMESGLLELDPSAVDNETVNAIFRAANSPLRPLPWEGVIKRE